MEGEIHLVGSDAVTRGRVMYCYNGSWYSVCADDWDISGNETRVLCSTAGFNNSDYGIYTYRYVYCTF